jgi:hypothetical protein
MMAESGPETVEQADVIALLLAHTRGDEKGCQELLTALGTADGVRLLSLAIGLALEVAYEALPGGRGELQRMLTGWQVRRRDSL